ncbi:TonB-dependent receptor [Halioglobus maricola]|nr:TonB-dependent receptor [Halioglobus maricola]
MSLSTPSVSMRAKPLACIVAALHAFTAPSTLAQQATLEEVIVTAQKREQNMMDVPVALTAVSTRDLQVYGVRDTADLTKLSPSLTYDQTTLAQNSGFRIRGIGTVVYSVSAESAVAVVIDDVATSQAGQALADLTDIERVEILRGPQSTLFGRNASAGVINVVTRGPTSEFEANAELTFTDDNQEKISASISGPISNALAYRLSGYHDEIDGWVNNLHDGDELDGSRRWGVNGRLDWDLSDTFSLDFQAKYDDSYSECCSPAFTYIEDVEQAKVLTVVPLTEAAPEIIPYVDDESTTVVIDDRPEADSENLQLSMKASWDIQDHSLLSITAYNNWDHSEFNELDTTAYPVMSYPFGNGTLGDPLGTGIEPYNPAVNGGVVQLNLLDVDSVSQEFRLLSPDAAWGNYIAGLYYSNMDADRQFDRWAPGLGVAAGLDAHNLSNNVVSSLSAFGQVTWNIGERSRLTLGGRYQYEEIEFDLTNVDFYGGGPDTDVSYEDDDNIALGSVAYQYDVSEDGMLFFRYAQGHKGQFFDAAASTAFTGELEPVEKESSDAFELGYKAELFDNTMRLELVGFYTLYDDYQAQQTTVTDAGAITFSTENVGELETYGIEIDSTTLIGDNFTLQLAAAWVDATIKEYPDAECYFGQTLEEGCVPGDNGISTQDLAGEDLQNSPDFKYNIAGTYVWPANNKLPGDVFANLSYSWTDKVNHDLQLAPWMEADSYGVLNLSLGMDVEGDINYAVTLFANNLLDDNYDSGLLDSSQAASVEATSRFVPRDYERYFGVRLKVGL